MNNLNTKNCSFNKMNYCGRCSGRKQKPSLLTWPWCGCSWRGGLRRPWLWRGVICGSVHCHRRLPFHLKMRSVRHIFHWKMSILQWKHSSVTVVRQEHRLLADLQFDQLTFKIVLLDYFVYDYVTLIFLMMNTAKQTFRQLDVYDVCQIFG